ncbi:MAG TPA: dihydroorotase [Acidobacteriaceae bacterium]|jgi:dihydroorotase|nr:dihydroorotase [Acidobacteriaceae bacterium]
MKTILIRGGHLIDPAASIDGLKDIVLKDGRVAEVAEPGKTTLSKTKAGPDLEIIEAKGLTVAPGLVDIHVHLREPGQGHKETIATGTAAAAAGGFTSVAAMPNTTPTNDTPDITRWMQAPERGAAIRVFPIGAATRAIKGEVLNNYAALKAAGVVAVTDDGHPILKDSIMREVLINATRNGLSVIQHAEDTRMTGGCSMNAGATAFRLGLRGMPPEAEYGLVERDIRLVSELTTTTNGTKGRPGAQPHLHVAHTSTAQAVAAVRQARRNGLRVTCEVAPHHFLLTEEHVGAYDTNAKMNPPLRSAADRDAMIQGILDGVVDAIATDHAPHASHEKEVEFERAPNGITGLESALGLSLRRLHHEWKLPLSRVLSLLSAQPAALLGLRGRGTLTVGSFADVVVFDPKAEWVFEAKNSRSKSKNTPFDGWTMQGKVRWTISEGRVAYTANA